MPLPGEVSTTMSWLGREVSRSHSTFGKRVVNRYHIGLKNKEGQKIISRLDSRKNFHQGNSLHLKRQEQLKMIVKVVSARNLTKACKKVVQNKGSAGIDGMCVTTLKGFLDLHRGTIVHQLISKSYRVQAIKGVLISKSNGQTRLLGIPTVVDRWLQQAVSQQLAIHFELDFEVESYGFRPKKNLQQAVLKSQQYINDGYQDIVDIDLKGFFDEVQHYKLLQLIYDKVKCPTTLWLVRKWLRSPILKNGRLHKRRKGLPQGSPLSPLLSNILLDQLDKYLKGKGHKFIRYADDFSIYTKSKAE